MRASRVPQVRRLDPETGDPDEIRVVLGWDTPEKMFSSVLDRVMELLLSGASSNAVSTEGFAALYDGGRHPLDLVSGEQTFSRDGHVEYHRDPQAPDGSARSALRSDLGAFLDAPGRAGADSLLLRLGRIPAQVHHVAVGLWSRASSDLPRTPVLHCTTVHEGTTQVLGQHSLDRPGVPHSARVLMVLTRDRGSAWTLTPSDGHATVRHRGELAAAVTRFLPTAAATGPRKEPK